MDDSKPCEWCNNTSGTIDSQEQNIESLEAEVKALNNNEIALRIEIGELKEAAKKAQTIQEYLNKNLNGQLSRRIIQVCRYRSELLDKIAAE